MLRDRFFPLAFYQEKNYAFLPLDCVLSFFPSPSWALDQSMTQLFDGTRRSFLKLGLFGIAACLPFGHAALALEPRGFAPRRLAFYNLHTDESLRVCYWRDGAYDKTGLYKINHILRDFRSGDTFPMHPKLMDLLHDLQARLGNDNPIQIISGYRSPRTNTMLAHHSAGVASHSYHMRGMAIDIKLDGTPLSHLRNTALAMQRGGVGYYPSSGFVHVDIGPVRRWG